MSNKSSERYFENKTESLPSINAQDVALSLPQVQVKKETEQDVLKQHATLPS
jgi:hypothetical protein